MSVPDISNRLAHTPRGSKATTTEWPMVTTVLRNTVGTTRTTPTHRSHRSRLNSHRPLVRLSRSLSSPTHHTILPSTRIQTRAHNRIRISMHSHRKISHTRPNRRPRHHAVNSLSPSRAATRINNPRGPTRRALTINKQTSSTSRRMRINRPFRLKADLPWTERIARDPVLPLLRD